MDNFYLNVCKYANLIFCRDRRGIREYGPHNQRGGVRTTLRKRMRVNLYYDGITIYSNNINNEDDISVEMGREEEMVVKVSCPSG